MEKTSVTLGIGEKTLTLEIGDLAQQATAAVLARLGDTMVMATVVAGKVREDIDYFPLTVEYVERLYAGGRIKGSRWVKREGRPSDQAILTARLIDRSIRPLFPKEYKNEVQIVVTVLSVDGENEPDVLSLVAVSTALAISKIPWNGPIGAVRVGFIKEKETGSAEFVINPETPQLDFSDLDLVVSQTKDTTVMIEASALFAPEDVVLAALEKAQKENKAIIEFIEELVKKVGQKKEAVAENTLLSQLLLRLEKSYKSDIESLIGSSATKEAAGTEIDDLVDRIYEEEQMRDKDLKLDKKTIAKAVDKVLYKIIRNNVLAKGKRPDGRGIDEIRPIAASVSVLPRTHGSAIFQRGNTQALTVVTLGSPKLEQLIESAEGEESKRYIHHYSMPPYSVGETGRIGTPSRREIGHGALAEKALLPVIPKQEKFPYTIRVVSEILSSNGSTSMAATCGSTLALMDAGVPIENPVAGVAMGMMSRSTSSVQAKQDEYVILTDILGLEDFSGDMDFKVTGTDKGVTAIQLDVKIPGLTLQQIQETLQRAKKGRLFILEKMLAVLPKTRTELSAFAPKIEVIKIPTEKIGEVIGPGGRIIRNIIAETGATVDVEDDGSVTVSGMSDETVSKAADWVRSLTREVITGEEFDGEVKRILPFGAFVEILPGKEGMVHVSKMAPTFVKNPSDVVSVGQKVHVTVVEIDEQGRINLSMIKGLEENKAQPQGHENRGEVGLAHHHNTVPHRQEQNEHPLTRQFRRERFQRTNPRSGGRSRGPRFRPNR